MGKAILIGAMISSLVVAIGSVQLGAQQPPMVTIEIQDFSFQPRDVQVPVGAAIRWLNRDRESPHTVTAEDGKAITSSLIDPGKEFTFVFNQPGQITYRCSVHPTMLGVIVVQGP
jgi:plastocyanin